MVFHHLSNRRSAKGMGMESPLLGLVLGRMWLLLTPS